MITPMVILAILAVLAGLLGLPLFLGLGWGAIEDFLHPVFSLAPAPLPTADDILLDAITLAMSVLASVVGFFVAYWLYVRNWGTAERWTSSAQWAYDLLYNGFYVDEGYTRYITRPLHKLSQLLADLVEARGIDGAVNGLARLTGLVGEGLRRLQTGLVRHYALALLIGAVAIVAYFVVRSMLG